MVHMINAPLNWQLTNGPLYTGMYIEIMDTGRVKVQFRSYRDYQKNWRGTYFNEYFTTGNLRKLTGKERTRAVNQFKTGNWV